MIGLLILSAAILTGFGCYHLSCTFVDVPTSRTSKTMLIAKKQTGSLIKDRSTCFFGYSVIIFSVSLSKRYTSSPET